MGDQFFNGAFPFIDLNSGGSVEGYIKTVAAVLEKIPADAKVIPGHGKLGTVDDLKNFHAMLVETAGLLKQGIADEKSIADSRLPTNSFVCRVRVVLRDVEPDFIQV